MCKGFGYFKNGKPIEEVINSIYNDVICKEKFGFIVFAGKKLQSEFKKYVDLSEKKCLTFDVLKRRLVSVKLGEDVANVDKQTTYVFQKTVNASKSSCKFHEKCKTACVRNKLERIVPILNYFIENYQQIHEECPFKFKENDSFTSDEIIN